MSSVKSTGREQITIMIVAWLTLTPTLTPLLLLLVLLACPTALSSSVWSCTPTNTSVPSSFCRDVPVPPHVCTDDGVFDDNQRTKKKFRSQLQQCTTLKKKKETCPNDPSQCSRDVFNKTTYCGGNDQICTNSSSSASQRDTVVKYLSNSKEVVEMNISTTTTTCLSFCYADCYPCNDQSDCDLLVSFGVLAPKNQTDCFSLEKSNGAGGRILPYPVVSRMIEKVMSTRTRL